MLKWLLKKLGYVHESELEFHHCNCCSMKATWNMVTKYYDKAMLDHIDDSLVYGAGITASTGGGSTVVWNRLSPNEFYKKGVKRGNKKKNQRRA